MTIYEAVKIATQAQKNGVWEIEAWKVHDALLKFFEYYKASLNPTEKIFKAMQENYSEYNKGENKMTIRKAVSVIQTVLQSTIYEMQKRNDPVANELDKAWIVVREIALKTENSLSDEGTTTAWKNMPESPNDERIENFIHNTKTWLCSLERKTDQCETDICMLWDVVEAIKDKMPREWGK